MSLILIESIRNTHPVIPCRKVSPFYGTLPRFHLSSPGKHAPSPVFPRVEGVLILASLPAPGNPVPVSLQASPHSPVQGVRSPSEFRPGSVCIVHIIYRKLSVRPIHLLIPAADCIIVMSSRIKPHSWSYSYAADNRFPLWNRTRTPGPSFPGIPCLLLILTQMASKIQDLPQ